MQMLSPDERAYITVGMEVGWLGFPALCSIDRSLCFLSGRVSFVDHDNHRYLVDGTNVEGCSGGPVFRQTSSGLRIIGALIQYITNRNRNKQGLLPGLSAAADVSSFSALESALAKLLKRQVSLTTKLSECPQCDAQLTE